MLSDRDHLEQELRAKAEEAIRKLLDALPNKSDITMSDMEALTGELGHEVMQGTMQSLSQSQQAEPDEVRCEECNTPMHKRGKRKKQVVTLRGEIEVERPYYICPCCGAGTFPPG
jgi:Zn finger protein HypA/HybF involved in hydrogenase expression